jgi:hypothetical protein
VYKPIEPPTPIVYNDGLRENTPGTKGSAQFLRSYECTVCRQFWKENQVIMFRGKPYGVPCGCFRDIRKLASGGK